PDREPAGRAGPPLRAAAADPGGPGAAAPLAGGGVRSQPGRVHLRPPGGPGAGGRHGPLPERRQAGLPPARLPRDVHVPAGPAEPVLERLAPPPVAPRPRERPERLRAGRRAGAALAPRPPLRRSEER